ncbi:MAG TPA: T9SS type A sorting domain-containing protein [Ignavibacteria bacterium]|nr:hypothetical protein [Bacteroidota bacterium]HRI86151.1 T9SS type A sorting domain-containing protein [Ignavibacteria bacterium]HRJ98397.1 T9SS type A sorting domain-containing protein [Ignavibacteria bacterium]
MKTQLKNPYIFLFFLICFSFPPINVFSQDECGTQDFPNGPPVPNNFFGGYLKPHRTDLDNGNPSNSNATFNKLFVFIQFLDDTASSDEWPVGDPPVYMNKFLVKDKNNTVNFWENYRDSSLSDYYQEISKGALHVTGEARHLITYHNWSHYQNMTKGYDTLLVEIYSRLKADTTIQWLKFDQWSRNDSNNNYVYERDKYLDMMGLFFRKVIGQDFIGAVGYPGYVPLMGPSDFILFANNNDTVKVGNARNKYGSGFVVKGTNVSGPLGFYRSMGIAIHEYGHYLFGNIHSSSGIMTSNGGMSINDLFMSGYERYKLGLLDTLTVNFNQSGSYSIKDVSGRNGTGQSPDFPQMLKVPITSTDFFLIENRRKISKWDVYMLGDTARLDPFLYTGDYGKGIYIYHSNNIGLDYSGQVDIECADGLWDWANFGYEYPDWSNTSPVLVKMRSSLPGIVNNDFGGLNSYYNADGISAGSSNVPMFSFGRKHEALNGPAIDRIYTNSNELWTSREMWGDRWDSWNIGYNQVFSPYSNPNTKSYGNAKTGIFIYYKSLTNGIAGIEVYKDGVGGHTDSSILQITPPSKPMGLVVDYHVETENIMRPILTWNHNREPDMLITSNNKKKYKIWRATSAGMSVVPVNYTLHNIVEIDSGTAPSYIDTTIYAVGSGWPGMGNTTEYPVRYKIQAVDKYQDTSVRSDFDMGVGLHISDGCAECHEEEEDNINSQTDIPREYKLYSNYPNPFNPSTNIKFDLPKDVQVYIKIYDMVGREVKTLVNEFKTAGRYSVTFSGSDFASGVYYYKIKAGEFEQVRKMILLK